MTTHTHRRRYTAAFFALTLPLAMACLLYTSDAADE